MTPFQPISGLGALGRRVAAVVPCAPTPDPSHARYRAERGGLARGFPLGQTNTGLPQRVLSALAAWPEHQAASAAVVLETALAPWTDTGGRVWDCSKLGRRGFPFELSFKGAHSDLRYTVEVDRPDRRVHRRLRRALAVAKALGGADWPGGLVEPLYRLHTDQAGELRFGAWLGARHGRGLRLKLYAELPAAAAAWVRSIEEAWGFESWSGARPLLAGVESGCLELYYEVDDLRAHELPAVLARAGFEPQRTRTLRWALEQAYGLSLDRGMPAPTVGLSYGLAKTAVGGVETFTLYHPADAVLGSDRSIRRRWLEMHGVGDGRYDAVSAPLATVGGRGGTLHHGLFGITVARQAGEAILSLGLTPPQRA